MARWDGKVRNTGPLNKGGYLSRKARERPREKTPADLHAKDLRDGEKYPYDFTI